jgi:2-polyprenyl-3-methyl-5-hydroxy-6-metoxy-1,4-benzoquinol methylase
MVKSEARCVLDVGCSVGALGKTLKERNGACVHGIELCPEMAACAAEHLDSVLVGDAAAIITGGKLGASRYDTIIFADVLEHLQDPWGVLRSAVRYLEPDGSVIASLPNVRHMNTLFNLAVCGRWPYRERGIHDRTHLRFFTRSNVRDLFMQAGLTISKVRTNYRIIETPSPFNGVAPFLALPLLRDFLAFQYLVRAERN